MEVQNKPLSYYDFPLFLNDWIPHFTDEDWDFVVKQFTLAEVDKFVQALLGCPLLVPRLKAGLSRSKPQSKDLFIEALSRLCDDGEIDVLVRHLNWQHEDIAFLTSQLKSYESSLAKLDDLRVACARLRDQANRLRERNSALIKALRESSIPLPKKPKQHEKSKKNKNSSR